MPPGQDREEKKTIHPSLGGDGMPRNRRDFVMRGGLPQRVCEILTAAASVGFPHFSLGLCSNAPPPRFLKGDPPLKQHEARIFCFLSFFFSRERCWCLLLLLSVSLCLPPFSSPEAGGERGREGGRWKRGEI